MADRRPNIVFIMADDHAAHAIGAYGSAINETPGIDRLAREGMPHPEEWELFDLEADPLELRSLYDDRTHAGVLADLRAELDRLSDAVGDVAPDADPRARRKGTS